MAKAAAFAIALVVVSLAVRAAAPPQTQSSAAPDVREMFSLAGQGGLPPGFRATPQALADDEGLRGGEVRTLDTDYIDRDFTLDLLFKFQPQERSAFVVGIGQNGEGGANSVLCRVFSPTNGARATMFIAGQPELELGKLPEAGPSLLRLQKKGNALTMTIVPKYSGSLRPAITRTIVDLHTASRFLNRATSPLFFSGDATFQAVRLVSSGRVTTAPATQPAPEPDPIDREPFFSLAGQASLPSYLRTGPRTVADTEGLYTMDAGTTDTDYIDKDFTLDVEVQFKDTQKTVALIALGEMDRAMVGVHVQSQTAGGGMTIVATGLRETAVPGTLGPSSKPRFFRFKKRGNTLSMSLSFDEHQRGEPTISRTIPDLKAVTPFLNRANGRLIFAGECTFRAVRLTVDGKPVDPHRAEVAPEKHRPAEPFFDLAGPVGLPKYLRAGADALADPDGLRTRDLHTVATDLIDFDFTFDLLFQFRDEREKATFRADIGGVGVQIGSPGAGGAANVHVPGQPPIELGQFDTLPREGFLRLEKIGRTLTISIVPAYQGQLDPLMTRTIPDLKTADPSLSRLNSGIVISGDCTWKAVRFWLEGKLQDPGQPTTRPRQASEPTGKFIHLSREHFPDYLTPSTGLVFNDNGLATAEKLFRTIESDFVDKDFTFDVVYSFRPGERAILFVGLGEGRPNGIWCANSLGSRVHGLGIGGEPSPDGAITISCPEAEGALTRFGDLPGPHLLRLQKRGNLVTFWARANFTGDTTPDAVKYVPDLRAAVPGLDSKNSYLFFGSGGTVEQIRLSVDGKPVDMRTPLTTPPNTEVVHVPATRPARLMSVDPLYRTPLPDGPLAIAPGLARSVLLLLGNKLWRMEADGFGVREIVKLPRAYDFIVERPGYFLALSAAAKTLDLIDRQTLQIRRGIQMDYPTLYALAADPTKPLCYVGVEKSATTPPHAVLIVNESSGDVFEPVDLVGQWLCVSPNGATLYAVDLGSASNPASLPLKRPHPELPAADLLIEYDLSGRLPRQGQIKEGAAGGILGLVLSPDGHRLSVLSRIGYPPGSGNSPAWDPTNLVKRPVSYACQANSARCDRIAFHPILPIVAAPTASSAVCFDRETGSLQPGRVDVSHVPREVKVEDLFFSPDGRNLLLVCTAENRRYLCRLPITLSRDEEAQLFKADHARH